MDAREQRGLIIAALCKLNRRDSVRSKSDVAMVNEVLCKLLCHNICCLIQEHCELGIEPVFWTKQKPAAQLALVAPVA